MRPAPRRIPSMRTLRYGIWAAGAVGMVWFLIVYTPWHKFFGTNHAPEARPGVPIVAAIYRFHNDCGLWPEDEREPLPGYPKGVPAPWYYNADPRLPAPQLSRAVRGDMRVGYDFDPAERGWKAWGTVEKAEPIAIAQEIPAASLPREQVLQNMIGVIDRRIAREPELMEHDRAKAWALRQLGRTGELRTMCQRLAERHTQAYWPRLALAVVAVEQAKGDRAGAASGAATTPVTSPATAADAPPSTGSQPASGPADPVAAFAGWVRANPGFTHSFYLYVLERHRGDTAAALRAAEQAIAGPLGTNPDDPQVVDAYACELARFAYQHKLYQCVLNLCDAWEGYYPPAEQASLERSYLAFRAAAWLALGDTEKAKDAVGAALVADDRRRLWAKNLRSLRDAIRRGDTGYRWDPGTRPTYEVFAEPYR